VLSCVAGAMGARLLLLLLSLLLLLLVFGEVAEHDGAEARAFGRDLLRSVLRVGLPPRLALPGDPLGAARATEHALRAFCNANDVSALSCAELHTHVSHRLAGPRPNGSGGGGGGGDFALLLPGRLNNRWVTIMIPPPADGASPASAAGAAAAHATRAATALGMGGEGRQRAAAAAAVAARAVLAMGCAFVVPLAPSASAAAVLVHAWRAALPSCRGTGSGGDVGSKAPAQKEEEAAAAVVAVAAGDRAGDGELQQGQDRGRGLRKAHASVPHALRLELAAAGSPLWRACAEACARLRSSTAACAALRESVRRAAREWAHLAPLCERAMPAKAGAAARQVFPAQLISAGGQRAGEQEAEEEAAELQGQGAEGRCLLFLDVCVAGGGVAGGWRISGPATTEMALLRAVGCGARTPLFDAGAEQSGIVYDVGSFKLPSWSRLPDTPPSGRFAATLVLFPPYHPNFGHFVLDVLPMLWRDGARICQAVVRKGSVASDKKQALPLQLLVLLPPPAPPLPPHHLLLLEGVMRAALAREPGCQGLLPSHRELRLVVHGMLSTDEVSCHTALLSCCSGSGIGTQPPGHPLFDGEAIREAVAAAAAHAAFLSKEPAPDTAAHPGVLIITRSDKRRITNEAALIARCRALPAVQALGGCALIDLGSTDDAKRNVEKLHSAAVLVGVFGAGLTNALFLGGGAGVAGWRAAVIEVVPFRFEECVAWSSFYRALFKDSASLGRVRRYEQLRTAAAAQSSVQCRFLPERLRHPLPGRQQELGSECSAEWLDAMPPGSFADCHVSNDPERLALVLRDQDTVVDVEAFEAALERASQAVAVADLSL